MRSCSERKLIGEVLVERGVVTEAQLQAALDQQKREPSACIGEILSRTGDVSQIDIVIALIIQYNLPYIAVSRHVIDQAVIRLIPADIVHREKVVPLDRIGNILSVVMENPLDETLREEMERLSGCRIAVFISTPSEIRGTIDRLYGKDQ